MGHYVGDGHGDQDAEVKQSDAIADAKGAAKGRRSTRNVFKEAEQSKLIESMAQDIATLQAEMKYAYTELDYLHSLELSHNLIIVTYTVADNTAAQAINSGAWRTRNLNTITHDSEGIAKLSSNQVTIPAGAYTVHAQASFATNNASGYSQIRLRDITSGVTIYAGDVQRTPNGIWGTVVNYLAGEFTTNKTIALELQHRVGANGQDTPLINTGWGEGQTRATLELIKVA